MIRALFFALLLLTACSPFARQPVSEPELPEKYLGGRHAGAAILPDRWWEGFADPQLNQLQEQLLAGNLDLRQALHRLQQLDALQAASGASRWPSLTLGGSASRDKSGSSGAISDSARISLAASYEIDLWDRLQNREQAAALRRAAGHSETQTLLLSLSAQLADQYFIAAEQRAQLRLAEQQLDTSRKLLKTIEDRYRAGIASAGELYQAQQNTAQVESRRPAFRAAISRADNSIALLLGQLPQANLTRIDRLPEPTLVIDSGLPASLLTRRPDVQAALLQLQAVDEELAAAMADRLPAVNLSASLGRAVSGLASGDLYNSFWSLALGLTQPLFDGGRRQSEVDRQQALRDERLAGYQKAILTAVQEVESALASDQGNAERLRWLEEQYAASQKEFDVELASYQAGLSDSRVLLRSQLATIDSASQLLSARRQWLASRITLARALGGGWMADSIDRQLQSINTQD